MAIPIPMKRTLRRRRDVIALASHMRIILARVRFGRLRVLGEDDGDEELGSRQKRTAAVDAAPAATQTTDRPLDDEDDEEFERTLRQSRRGHFTRLCIEQLYRFEEA